MQSYVIFFICSNYCELKKLKICLSWIKKQGFVFFYLPSFL